MDVFIFEYTNCWTKNKGFAYYLTLNYKEGIK